MTETVTVNEVLDYFKLESASESWSQYFLVALEQVIKGKYADESNIIGTVGEVGVAFTGLDVVQDLRDLSYDVTNWEWSWGHVGETALDAVGLVPIVGVLSKGDTATVLIKHTDKVYELRKVAKLDNLLETIKKIDGSITDLVGSANVVFKSLGQEVSASLYKALDNVKINNNRYALATGYDTVFARAFDDLADEAKELYDLSPTAVQQAYRKAILKSTDMTGKVVKNEDEITEAGRKAIADEKAAVLAGESGSNTSFTGKLRGEDVTLYDVNVQEITLKKRSASELSQLRSEFDTSVRKNFLKELGKQTEYLKEAGFTDGDILKIQNGYVPTGWQVHHKIPLDGGGTNTFSNLVLIQNEPYHKVLTNYQNDVMKDMKEFDEIIVSWPQPNGNIYPKVH